LKTIIGQFKDAMGNPIANGKLTLQLSQDALASNAQIGPVPLQITLDPSGNIPSNTQLFANDELLPLNTYYTVTVTTDTGVAWGPQLLQIVGASPIDLTKIIPLGGGLPAVVPATSMPYDISLYVPGVFTSSQNCAEMNIVRAFTLPGGLGGSIAKLDAAPTSSAVFSIQRNGSQIGTITFGAGATTGTLAMASPAFFNPTDTLRIVAPSSADATAAGLSLSILGSRA
jgi:hypothetical protein